MTKYRIKYNTLSQEPSIVLVFDSDETLEELRTVIAKTFIEDLPFAIEQDGKCLILNSRCVVSVEIEEVLISFGG